MENQNCVPSVEGSERVRGDEQVHNVETITNDLEAKLVLVEDNGINSPNNNHEILSRQVVFPPPCTWYEAHVADARDDMWGYLSMSVLVIAKSDTDGSSPWPNFQLMETGTSKLTSISFCQSPFAQLPIPNCPVVTGDEKGIVRLWNLESGCVLQTHDVHKGNRAIAQWSPKDANLIYSVDSLSNICVWSLSQRSLRVMNCGKIAPTCLAVSPFEDDIVAVGSKGGHVQIIDTGAGGNRPGKILVKMRHDEEVYSVAWKPKGSWAALLPNAEYQEPFLVSSVSTLKPSTIRVWDRSGKDILILRPNEKEGELKKLLAKNCLPVRWVSDTWNEGLAGRLALMSSGRSGEIMEWSESSTVSDAIHSLHNNHAIFSVIQCGHILWSFSYEPIIIGWNLKNDHIEAVIPTFKGVCSLQVSPVDYSRVALGGADQLIRIVGMDEGYPENIVSKVPTLARVHAMVTAVSWHPIRETKLAFGTNEGIIGICDFKGETTQISKFERRAGKTIYSLDWGPKTYVEDTTVPQVGTAPVPDPVAVAEDKSEKMKLNLYACDGNTVYMINPIRSNNPLINVNSVIMKSNPDTSDSSQHNKTRIRESCTDIKWSPDYAYFALGYKDGRIELYSAPNLKLRCWIKCHGRGIQCLAWRSFDFSQSNSNSDVRMFATASNDGTARLFNLGHLFTPEFMTNKTSEVHQLISSLSTLNGHDGLRVVSLAWSSHDPDLLVTVSYDRAAIVWNARTGERIARYTGHHHRLVGCMFHPTDPYKIITTSDELMIDFSIHVWDYRNYPYKHDSRRVKASHAPKGIAEKIESIEGKEELVQAGIKIGDEANNIISRFTNSSNRLSEAQPKIIKKEEKPSKKTKPKALLPITSNALVNAKHSLEEELRFLVDKSPMTTPMPKHTIVGESLVDTSDVTSNDGSVASLDSTEAGSSTGHQVQVEPSLHLAILGTSEECAKLLKVERQGHIDKGNWDYALHLSNLLSIGGHETMEAFIHDAIKAGQVSETMLLIASTQSKLLYNKCMEAYIKQLIDATEYYKASNFLCLSGRTDEAIDLLVKYKLYRDAAALSKCLLPPEITDTNDLLDKWIERTLEEGNFELACKLAVSVGRYDDALSMIEKRNLPYAWKAGLFIAVKANDKIKAEGLGVKCLDHAMVEGNFEECFKIIEEFQIMKWMLPIVLVHEEVLTIAKAVPDKDLWNEMVAKFPETITAKWNSKNIFDESEFYLTKIRSLLLLAIPQSIAETQIIIAKNLALIFLDKNCEKSSLKEMCGRLSQQWIQIKNPSLDITISAIISKLSD